MLQRKHILFVGIIALVTGLIAKQWVEFCNWPLMLIMTGGSLKLLYVALEITSKSYHPGKELLLLILGLLVFFAGIYLGREEVAFAYLMMITGLMLKVSFVIFFIRKKRVISRRS